MPRDAPSFQRRGRVAGFSLFELVMVITIVGVLAVVALPRLTNASAVTVPAEAARLAASIRYTQGLAMSRGQRYRINFTANTYQITDMAGAAIVQPLTASTAPVSVSPATLGGYDPPLAGGYVAFDTRGVPYVSPTAPLAGSATITVASGVDAASIVVAPETGRVQ